MAKIGALAVSLLLGGLAAGGPEPAGTANAQALDDGSQTGAREAPVSGTAALTKRALVTFFKSRLDEPSAATAVTVVNNSGRTCRVRVDWFVQSEPDEPACSTSLSLAPGVARDFCSREIPDALTTCNSTCDPELEFEEGKAIVSSTSGAACGNGAVDARVYYTAGEEPDADLQAISNPRVVPLR
jgi:hypothetical protein